MAEKKPALERLAGLQGIGDSAAVVQLASDLVEGSSWSWGGFPLRRYTMDELVGSGKLHLLSPDVRDALGR
jgi:hypothetical protein